MASLKVHITFPENKIKTWNTFTARHACRFFISATISDFKTRNTLAKWRRVGFVAEFARIWTFGA